ncbi:MAG: ATP-binding protein [Candidimonas sp.]
MPFISVPKNFFKKERNQVYSNWKVAFWRELIQNSVDVNCTEITIKTKQHDDHVSVCFSDNGPGMTRHVLENVYFKLGETTKNENQMGGFGRARILTCFSMQSYQIETQEWIVQGDGSEYDIKKSENFYNGCKLSINVDDCTESTLLDGLYFYLKKSHLKQSIVINDNSWNDWIDRGRFVKSLGEDIPFAGIYVNKNGSNYNLIVQVDGVMMFNKWTLCNTQIVVDIDRNKSKNVLTASRDSLHHDYEEELDNFISSLAKEKSVLKPQHDDSVIGYDGDCFIKKTKKKDSVDVEFNTLKDHTVNLTQSSSVISNTPIEDVNQKNNILKFFNFASIKVVNEIDKNDPYIRRFYPQNWNYKNDILYGKDAILFLMIWQELCDYAADVILEYFDDDINYSVGWIFSSKLTASETANGGHYILINPIIDFCDISDRTYLLKMAALAKHEMIYSITKHDVNEQLSLSMYVDMKYDQQIAIDRVHGILIKHNEIISNFWNE